MKNVSMSITKRAPSTFTAQTFPLKTYSALVLYFAHSVHVLASILKKLLYTIKVHYEIN